MKKNDEYIIDITGIGAEGEGVGRVDGMAVFVPYALPGEKVRIKLVKVQKSLCYGKLMEVLQPSEQRLEPECPYFYKCGGCAYWHCSYEGELQAKWQHVQDCIKRIGKIDCPVSPVIGAKTERRYRNKAMYPVTADGIGFYAGRSHRVIEVEDCLIQRQAATEVVQAVRNWMKQFNVAPYCEETDSGNIRNIYVRTSASVTECMVCIVTRHKNMPAVNELVAAIQDALPDLQVQVVQNVNRKKTNVVLGDEYIPLCGDGRIRDSIDDVMFEISPQSFFQVNPEQTKVLYSKAAEFAGLTGRERVLDLYCGIGTISLFLANGAKQVVGVEYLEQAVEDARRNAAANGIENASFMAGAAEKLANKLPAADVVVVDPPRKGCAPELLEAIAKRAPERVVYVSCNPATLARDLQMLEGFGYRTTAIQPVDMFPRTKHCEVVCALQRQLRSDINL